MQQQYDTPEALRSFLKLCLDPGYGIRRSPEKLVEVLPEPLARKSAEFAPHLSRLRHQAQALDEQATRARRAYADGLATWIDGEEPPSSPATPRRSMPLLEAVTAAYDTAVCSRHEVRHLLARHASRGDVHGRAARDGRVPRQRRP